MNRSTSLPTPKHCLELSTGAPRELGDSTRSILDKQGCWLGAHSGGARYVATRSTKRRVDSGLHIVYFTFRIGVTRISHRWGQTYPKTQASRGRNETTELPVIVCSASCTQPPVWTENRPLTAKTFRKLLMCLLRRLWIKSPNRRHKEKMKPTSKSNGRGNERGQRH